MKSEIKEIKDVVQEERKSLTFNDLLPGEFGEIIGFKYSSYDNVSLNFGTIIYNAGKECLILKPAPKSKWKVNGLVENDLYYIKKITLIGDCFYDEEELKEHK